MHKRREKIKLLILNPHFWIILIIFSVLLLLHYPRALLHSLDLTTSSYFGLERHAIERTLLLIPLSYSAFKFGLQGGILGLFVSACIMFPRVIFISSHRKDSLFEMVLTISIGVLINWWFESRRREIDLREKTLVKLKKSRKEREKVGRRFREIFEKAHDAIWIQNSEGQIITANKAAARLLQYTIEELRLVNISRFLTPRGLEQAKELEQKLLNGCTIHNPYEQIIIKQNGDPGILMLTTSVLGDESEPYFLQIARDMTEEKKMQENLRLYADQIHTAYEEERKRIARELHDDTIQTLVAISRTLDTYLTSNTIPETRTSSPLEKIHKNIDECLVRIRRFIQDLRPPTLEYLGLIPALREMMSEIREQSHIDFQFTFNTDLISLKREQELLIYRIIQEGMRNIWKHSRAEKADIIIEADEKKISLEIRDNGRGFELKNGSLFLEKGKLGLMGMKERSHLLGGELHIYSEINKGTRILFTLEL
jgi:PAS domain S-box-containing protein